MTPSGPLLSDIAIFVRVAEAGSFTTIAEEEGVTASGVSRMITRLETRLGARLLHRSTRRLVLTQEGETFLPHALDLVDRFEAAEAALSTRHGRARGHIRINTSGAISRLKLAPLLARFLTEHPEITTELTVSDRRIDPVAEQIDVTIRVGRVEDAELIGVKLGVVQRVIAAAPSYLERCGAPERPDDLRRHNCLVLRGSQKSAHWPMIEDGKRVEVPVSGSMRADSAEALLEMALNGFGVVRFGDFLGAEALAAGRLRPLLTSHHDPDPQPITALVAPSRLALPRIRLLLEALKHGFRAATPPL